jgi:hypothetical protein
MAKWTKTCSIAFNFKVVLNKVSVNKVELEMVKSVQV